MKRTNFNETGRSKSQRIARKDKGKGRKSEKGNTFSLRRRRKHVKRQFSICSLAKARDLGRNWETGIYSYLLCVNLLNLIWYWRAVSCCPVFFYFSLLDLLALFLLCFFSCCFLILRCVVDFLIDRRWRRWGLCRWLPQPQLELVADGWKRVLEVEAWLKPGVHDTKSKAVLKHRVETNSQSKVHTRWRWVSVVTTSTTTKTMEKTWRKSEWTCSQSMYIYLYQYV